MEYNLLAPIIVGGAAALIGLAVLIWMNNSEPRLRAPVGSEEEPSLPFQKLTPSELSFEERLLRAIFSKPDKSTSPTLTTLTEQRGNDVVVRRRAQQSADT